MLEDHTTYLEGKTRVEMQLVEFVRAVETHLEGLDLRRLAAQSRALEDTIGGTVRAFRREVEALRPPPSSRDVHVRLLTAVGHFVQAYDNLLRFVAEEAAMDFLKGHHELCRGKYILYEVREHSSILKRLWVHREMWPMLGDLERRASNVEAPVGIVRKEASDQHARYCLYVPENYTDEKSWPVIVCLHGGYSREDDYLLTWLRSAKSKGYIILAPKSTRETWSAIRIPGIAPNPILDRRSIRAMLEEVWNEYAVDREHIFLTGFSDGGIFAYVLGIAYADLFAGIASVAGRIHPSVDHLLKQGQGKNVPIFMVHGERDSIFPVDFARQTRDGLTKIGYDVTYRELPGWGHGYPFSVNEDLVMPWFENLASDRSLDKFPRIKDR